MFLMSEAPLYEDPPAPHPRCLPAPSCLLETPVLWVKFEGSRGRLFFVEDLLVRIHFIIVMIRWNGLAP